MSGQNFNLSSQRFQFMHHQCFTPRVFKATPSVITFDTTIEISGIGFSSESCYLTVKFDQHICDISWSNETTIICKLNITGKPQPNRELAVSVHVSNRGYALQDSRNPRDFRVKLKPVIFSMTPKEGSLGGGTLITLEGTGFTSGSVFATLSEIVLSAVPMTYTKMLLLTGKPSIFVDRQLPLTLQINGISAECSSTEVCLFSYVNSTTPIITSISPTAISSVVANITITGEKFGTDTGLVNISIGSVKCLIYSLNDTMVQCTIIGLVSGIHKLSFKKGNVGLAWSNVTDTIRMNAVITKVSPKTGSQYGGTDVTITGCGFDRRPRKVSVTISNKECIVKSVTSSTVICTTLPGSNWRYLRVISGEVYYPLQLFRYWSQSTPAVSSVSPNSGYGGQSVTIHGSKFSDNTADVTVTIGSAACSVINSSESTITCTLAVHPSGSFSIKVHIKGKGFSNDGIRFQYNISISSIRPSQSSYGGGINVTVTGNGFSQDTVVTICDNPCLVFKESVTNQQLICEVPSNHNWIHGNDKTCSVSVRSTSYLVDTLPDSYTYKDSMTYTVTMVTPSRGGTGGGVRVYITGTRFVQGNTIVTIAGVPCAIKFINATNIECVTGPSKRTIKTDVRVDVGSNGKALVTNGEFYYVDVWSSMYSWGGRSSPVKGKC